MTVTLAFLAVLMGIVVWWLVRQTINTKPWVASAPVGAQPGVGFLPPVKVALGVLLAVITSLFALFVSAYAIRMEYGDWRPVPEPQLLWANTGILFLGSVGLQLAWRAAGREDWSAVRRWLPIGGACALAFMIGQFVAWRQLAESGYIVSGNPANAFFYTLTGLHVLHLLGGLVAWARTVGRAWGGESMAKTRLGVELCAVYWHFLFVVWLILFGLMLST